MEKKKNENNYYVNNADFTKAIVEYVSECNAASEAGKPVPIVTNYIAQCFLNISENLSRKSNFGRYTFREEMVMDGVEDCLRRIQNYDVNTPTRTGKPNPFGYFTQIIWWAFVRRIKKEKKRQEDHLRYISETGIDQLVQEELESNPASAATMAYVEELRQKFDTFQAEKEEESKKKKRKKRTVNVDSDLRDFI